MFIISDQCADPLTEIHCVAKLLADLAKSVQFSGGSENYCRRQGHFHVPLAKEFKSLSLFGADSQELKPGVDNLFGLRPTFSFRQPSTCQWWVVSEAKVSTAMNGIFTFAQ